MRGVRIADPGHPDLPREASVMRPASPRSKCCADRVHRRRDAVRSKRACRSRAAREEARHPPSPAPSPPTRCSAVLSIAARCLAAALVAEEQLAGRHIDNLAPALFGGILLIRSIEPLRFTSLPVPPALRITLVHPRDAAADRRNRAPCCPRRSIARRRSRRPAPSRRWSPRSAPATSRCCAAPIDDRIAEPARAPLLPGFVDAKAAALDAGALGCSISGGGPSAFALSDDDDRAAPDRRRDGAPRMRTRDSSRHRRASRRSIPVGARVDVLTQTDGQFDDRCLAPTAVRTAASTSTSATRRRSAPTCGGLARACMHPSGMTRVGPPCDVRVDDAGS